VCAAESPISTRLVHPIASVLTVTPSMFGRKFSVTMQIRRGREFSKALRASIALRD
jgi:hypothetical protein